jgi:hypothetical protein
MAHNKFPGRCMEASKSRKGSLVTSIHDFHVNLTDSDQYPYIYITTKQTSYFPSSAF